MDLNHPKVSVVVATYNRRNFLPETIDSVLNQTFTNFEFIIVDDGSTDDTQSLMETYKDPRIRYIYTKNQGRSKARNYALSLVRSELIAFLDSDDMFTPYKLEKQVAFLDAHPDYGMVYTAANVIDGEGKAIPEVYQAPVSGDIYYDIAFYLPTILCLPTVMVRKSVLDKAGYFDETMTRFEDTDIWRRVSKVTKIKAFPQILTTVRTHSDNQMEDPDILYGRLEYWINKCFREDTGYDLKRQKVLAAAAWFHYGWAIFHRHHYQLQAYRFFFQALKYRPFRKAYWFWYLRSKIPRGKKSIIFKTMSFLIKRTLFKRV